MSPTRTVAPSYVAFNFKVSANVVTLCSRLKNEKCTWFSLCSVELYISLNIIIYFLVFLFTMFTWLGATKLWSDGAMGRLHLLPFETGLGNSEN